METETHVPNTGLEPTQSPATLPADTALEAKLKALEKAQDQVFSTVKWTLSTILTLLGSFLTLAILFTGFNWWAGKANYERDREYFEARLKLSEEQLLLGTSNEMSELGRKYDHQTLLASNELWAKFATLQEQNSRVLNEEFNFLTNGLRSGFSNHNALIDHFIARKDAEYDANVSNLVKQLNEQGEQAVSGTRGLALAVQGDMTLELVKKGRERYRTLFDIGLAVNSLLEGGHCLSIANDEANLRSCLNRLLDEGFPTLIANCNAETMGLLQKRLNIDPKVQVLLADLEKRNGSGAYADQIERLRYWEKFVASEMSPDKK